MVFVAFLSVKQGSPAEPSRTVDQASAIASPATIVRPIPKRLVRFTFLEESPAGGAALALMPKKATRERVSFDGSATPPVFAQPTTRTAAMEPQYFEVKKTVLRGKKLY